MKPEDTVTYCFQLFLLLLLLLWPHAVFEQTARGLTWMYTHTSSKITVNEDWVCCVVLWLQLERWLHCDSCNCAAQVFNLAMKHIPLQSSILTSGVQSRMLLQGWNIVNNMSIFSFSGWPHPSKICCRSVVKTVSSVRLREIKHTQMEICRQTLPHM